MGPIYIMLLLYNFPWKCRSGCRRRQYDFLAIVQYYIAFARHFTPKKNHAIPLMIIKCLFIERNILLVRRALHRMPHFTNKKKKSVTRRHRQQHRNTNHQPVKHCNEFSRVKKDITTRNEMKSNWKRKDEVKKKNTQQKKKAQFLWFFEWKSAHSAEVRAHLHLRPSFYECVWILITNSFPFCRSFSSVVCELDAIMGHHYLPHCVVDPLMMMVWMEICVCVEWAMPGCLGLLRHGMTANGTVAAAPNCARRHYTMYIH